VDTPETIKWDSKYVPQAATYGGAGAFNYTEPETYRDPERPWLDDYYDARASTPNINWNDFVSQNYQPTANFHPASMYGSNLNPVFNQGNYPQGYNTPQIILSKDTLITDVYNFEISKHAVIYLNRKPIYEFCGEYTGVIKTVAKNDGLEPNELLDWFKYPKEFKGQVICWNQNAKY